MLPAQRQDRILVEIERSGGARIVQLAELLGVSDMTVRRDIDVLAARGLVKKVYGGATVSPQGTSDEPGFEAKSWRERAAKELIAAAAAALVQPKATIAVSAGTTTYAAAASPGAVPQLTVVTNSVRVADYLYRNGESSQTILLTGGLRTPSDALVGPIAVQTISDLHVDLPADGGARDGSGVRVHHPVLHGGRDEPGHGGLGRPPGRAGRPHQVGRHRTVGNRGPDRRQHPGQRLGPHPGGARGGRGNRRGTVIADRPGPGNADAAAL